MLDFDIWTIVFSVINILVLLAVVTQLLPYIGYPRTLNAIACLNEVIPERG